MANETGKANQFKTGALANKACIYAKSISVESLFLSVPHALPQAAPHVQPQAVPQAPPQTQVLPQTQTPLQAKPTVARGGNFRPLFARLLFIVIYFPFISFLFEPQNIYMGATSIWMPCRRTTNAHIQPI